MSTRKLHYIPLENRPQEVEERRYLVEESFPITGTESSLHHVAILPIWHPNRKFYKWLVLFVSCLFSVGSYFAYDSVGVVEVAIEEHFGITPEEFGLLYSVYSFPNIILPFCGGILLDRIGLPIGTTACTFLVMLGALLVALAPALEHSFFLLLAGRFIFGVGAETSYVAQNTICCVWFKDGKLLSFAMGIVISAGRLGSFVTFTANSKIINYFGSYTAALWAGAIFSFLCFIAGVTYMILHYYAQWMVKGTLAQLERAEINSPIRWRDLIGYSPAFYILTGIACVYYSAVFPFQSTAVGMLERTKGLSNERAGNYVSLIPATSLFLSPVFGIIVDKVGRKLFFILVGLLVMVPAFLLLLEQQWPTVVSFVMIGFCFAMVPAALWPCLPLLVDDRKIGTAFGFISSFMNAGLALVYWLMGKLQTDSGHEEIFVYSGMAGCGFLMGCVWLLLDALTKCVCNGAVRSKQEN